MYSERVEKGSSCSEMSIDFYRTARRYTQEEPSDFSHRPIYQRIWLWCVIKDILVFRIGESFCAVEFCGAQLIIIFKNSCPTHLNMKPR